MNLCQTLPPPSPFIKISEWGPWEYKTSGRNDRLLHYKLVFLELDTQTQFDIY